MANEHNRDESNFEITSKRRKGFPSETQVKRGARIVHGNKEPSEKLGRAAQDSGLRTVACAPGVITAVGRTTFFRE